MPSSFTRTKNWHLSLTLNLTSHLLTCIATWALVWMLLGSPLSLPQLHLTVCPATSVLCVATIACAADSFVENLKQIKCYKYYRSISHVKLFKWCDFVTEQDPIYFACCVFFHFSTILSSKGVNDVRKTCTIHRQAICLAKILKVSINEDICRQAPKFRWRWKDHIQYSNIWHEQD